MNYDEDQRRAYVRGALEACNALKVDVAAIVVVCRDLGITASEMVELADEERAKQKAAPDTGGAGLMVVQ
jgi:hypothetical protein